MEDYRRQEEDKKRWAGQSSVRPGSARIKDRKNDENAADPESGLTENEENTADHEAGLAGEDDPTCREYGVGYQVPRLPSRPKMPSQQEKEEHEATGHACYRSWCEHCVSGRVASIIVAAAKKAKLQKSPSITCI